MRVSHDEYLVQHLEAHALLEDVPLRDASAVDLIGGGDGRTIADVLRLMEMSRQHPSTAVRVLVGVRRFIGNVFHWDGEKPATVHAFACMALSRRASGYRLYWAVYVRNVSPLTPVYMAAIEPFRRWVVYPAILGGIRAGWRDL